MKSLIYVFSLMFLCSTAFCQNDEDGQPLPKPEMADPAAGMSATEMGEMDEKAMMEMWAKMIAPGEEHEKLAQDVGKYTYVSTFWMEPGAEPMKSTGKSTIEPIMDGRYFVDKHEGEMMGTTFKGMGVSGYDKVSKEYTSTWIDNMGTGTLMFRGKMNEQGQLETFADTVNPMTGQKEKHKTVITQGANGFTMDYFVISNGSETQSMNIVYTRVE